MAFSWPSLLQQGQVFLIFRLNDIKKLRILKISDTLQKFPASDIRKGSPLFQISLVQIFPLFNNLSSLSAKTESLPRQAVASASNGAICVPIP